MSKMWNDRNNNSDESDLRWMQKESGLEMDGGNLKVNAKVCAMNPVLEYAGWSMPSKETFDIHPIRSFLNRWIDGEQEWVDPFARRRHGFADHYNDLNPECDVDTHLSADEYLDWLIDAERFCSVLFDPPYSLRQVKECYDGFGLGLSQEETQTFYSNLKDKISLLVPPGGHVISFGWNTNGMGVNRGFEKVAILMCHHGMNHNDTLVTVEKKTQTTLRDW